jgi:hypothetical protein
MIAESEREPILQKARAMVSENCVPQVDGVAAAGTMIREARFISSNWQGLLGEPPTGPVRMVAALIGVTLTHPLVKPPAKVELDWKLFSPRIQQVTHRLAHPYGTDERSVAPDAPWLRWQMDLPKFDDAPPVDAATSTWVASAPFPVWAVSIAVAIALLLAVVAWRSRAMRPVCLAGGALVVLGGVWGAFHESDAAAARDFAEFAAALEPGTVLSPVLTRFFWALDQPEKRFSLPGMGATPSAISQATLLLSPLLTEKSAGNAWAGSSLRIRGIELRSTGTLRTLSENRIEIPATWEVRYATNHFGHIHPDKIVQAGSWVLETRDNAWRIAAFSSSTDASAFK